MYIAGNKQWRMLLEVALCTVLLSGCAAPTEKKEGSTAEIKQREETEKPQYVSDTLPKDCQLCGNGKEMTLFSLYEGEDNVGIISLNSFEISHIGINRYDDCGNMIEEASGGMSSTMSRCGREGFSSWITENSNRGYASGLVTFYQDEQLDLDKAASFLCTECLNDILEDCWDDDYFGVGVIDFFAGRIKLFAESMRAFSLGDFYVSCELREQRENEESRSMSLLIFYCPERYPEK